MVICPACEPEYEPGYGVSLGYCETHGAHLLPEARPLMTTAEATALARQRRRARLEGR